MKNFLAVSVLVSFLWIQSAHAEEEVITAKGRSLDEAVTNARVACFHDMFKKICEAKSVSVIDMEDKTEVVAVTNENNMVNVTAICTGTVIN